MSNRQKRLNSEQIVKILKKNGFRKISQRGSHQKWKNINTGKQVIVPFHTNSALPIGTLKSIIEGSGVPQDFWI